jgi:hypothetical protein
MLRTVLMLSLLTLIVGCAPTQQAPSEAVILEWGWGTPRLQDFPPYIERIQELPFDGAVIDVTTPLDERGLSWTLFTDTPVDETFLDALAADYGDLDWGRYDHNLLRMNVSPASVDWFDDAGWSVVLANAEAWAGLSNRLGFAGIMLDTEQYGESVTLFEYAARDDGRSYEDVAAAAYERGLALTDALEQGHPDLTIILTFSLTTPGVGDDFDVNHRYSLLPPFVEGMTAAAKDGTTIVDGYEQSYIYAEPGQFEAARAQMTTVPQNYAPEGTMRPAVGFGLWLDPFCGDGGLPVEGCGFSPEGFRVALDSAIEHGEGYVWIYNQRVNWYTNEHIPDEWWAVFNTFR